MRVLIIAILLAGCSSPEAVDQATDPIHTGGPPVDENGTIIEIEQVPMDPIEGTVTASGTATTQCGAVTGGTSLSVSRPAWELKAATNATQMTITADWSVPNPTMETAYLELQYQGSTFATFGGAPGFTETVDLHGVQLDDRNMALRIGEPPCGAEPVLITHYDDIAIDVRIEFA